MENILCVFRYFQTHQKKSKPLRVSLAQEGLAFSLIYTFPCGPLIIIRTALAQMVQLLVVGLVVCFLAPPHHLPVCL